jgi:predicted CoA-binding protein
VADPHEILRDARCVLLIDWPDAGVPRALLAVGETGYLVFERLEGVPSGVDVACVYRPRKELPEIIEGYVVPCGAKALWLQKPITSPEAGRLAAERGLDFVEGVDIAEVARSLRSGG